MFSQNFKLKGYSVVDSQIFCTGMLICSTWQGVGMPLDIYFTFRHVYFILYKMYDISMFCLIRCAFESSSNLFGYKADNQQKKKMLMLHFLLQLKHCSIDKFNCGWFSLATKLLIIITTAVLLMITSYINVL